MWRVARGTLHACRAGPLLRLGSDSHVASFLHSLHSISRAHVKSFLSGHKLQSSTGRCGTDWHYGYTLHIISRREWMLFCCCLVPRPLATVFARLARVGAQA